MEVLFARDCVTLLDTTYAFKPQPKAIKFSRAHVLSHQISLSVTVAPFKGNMPYFDHL